MAKLAITNLNLWNELRKMYPQFQSQTSEGTKDLFSDVGFEKLQNYNTQILNDFFNLSVRVALQIVNISHAKDPLADKGFGEYFDSPNGGVIQRMAVDTIKPVSPAYKSLLDFDSLDPYIVRKPKTSERFFNINFDYQSLITIQDFQMKQIFISEFGMAEYLSGIMVGLENGYINQVYLNKLQALNAGINSTVNPLQDTQVVSTVVSATPTATELTNLLLTIKNVKSAMVIAQTSAFNAMKFNSVQDESRLKLLVRPDFANQISTLVLAGTFNPEQLSLGIDLIPVTNFGGLSPVKVKVNPTDAEVPLYPVYDKLGTQIGWNTVIGSAVVTVENGNETWSDPNEDVIAVLADKGLIFETKQNPYSVRPIINPRGLYTNYWASSPNNSINIDPLYNMVVFKKTIA